MPQKQLIKLSRDAANPLKTWHWIVLAILTLSAAFLGGSSRHDMVQVLALRPIAAISLAAGLYWLKWKSANGLRPLIWLMVALALWTLLQLIPLPPSWWQALPGREAIAEMDAVLGFDNHWRPISLAPALGWASLTSLIVPAAALMLAAALPVKAKDLLYIVAGLGILCALMGYIQLAAGGVRALHFYAVNSLGTPTGLLANENHTGVFLAVTILAMAKLTISAFEARRSATIIGAHVFFLPFMFMAILINGSRAGIIFGLLASLIALLMFWKSTSSVSTRPRNKGRGIAYWPVRRIAFALAASIFIGLIMAFLTLDRIPGLSGAMEQDALEDLRWKLIDPLKEMVAIFWMAGVGFGSFAPAYMIYEPQAIALPSYVNQAHNDYFQFVIEGGLPALLLAAFLFAQIARKMWAVANQQGWLSSFFFMMVGALIIAAGASAVDYPLRTPLFQVIFVWLLCALFFEADVLHASEEEV